MVGALLDRFTDTVLKGGVEDERADEESHQTVGRDLLTEQTLLTTEVDDLLDHLGLAVPFGVHRLGEFGIRTAFVDGWVQSMWVAVGMAAVAFAYVVFRGPSSTPTAIAIPDGATVEVEPTSATVGVTK